jgi:hypothetical protein
MLAFKTQPQQLISRRPMESYPVRSSSLRGAFFALLFLTLLSGIRTASAGDWEVLRHEGRDYVTIQSLATFYGFPQAVRTGG